MNVSWRWASWALVALAACGGGSGTPTPTPPPVNLPPGRTLAQSLSTPRDTPLALTLSGTDPERATLAFAVASPPTHGALGGAAPALTYTPAAAGYEGPDAFTFTASDGTLVSPAATISITVTHVNRPPVAVADAATTDFGWPVAVAALANDTDADGDTISITAVVPSGPRHRHGGRRGHRLPAGGRLLGRRRVFLHGERRARRRGDRSRHGDRPPGGHASRPAPPP